MSVMLPSLPDCIPVSHMTRLVGKLFAISVSGAFGGIVYAVSTLFDGGRTDAHGVIVWNSSHGVPIRRFLLGQAGIGAGGAFAAVFGMLTIGNAVRAGATNDITDFPVYLIALCVVGGFIGNKLLTRVGDNLADQVGAANKKADQAKTAASQANVTANEAKGLVLQLDKVFLDISAGKEIDQELEDALGQQPSAELRGRAMEMLKKLSEYSVSLPTARTLAIVEANLSFDLGLTDQAFKVLEKFLVKKREAGMPEDDDDSSAWFNTACYHALILRKAAGGGPNEHIPKALEALGKSFEIAKKVSAQKLIARIQKAKDDKDLETIKGTPGFQALLDRFSKA